MAQTATESGYAFAQQPRAVSNRRKFRDPEQTDDRLAVNIMWDRRVVRGNTYSAQVLPATAVPDPVQLQKEAEKRKLSELKKRQKIRSSLARPRSLYHHHPDTLSRQTARPTTPDAVPGRKHMDVQTEMFLEEIADRPAEVDADTQTDPFMDRPPTPLFIPKKTGIDRETQIFEGELFDFDFEVEPILQVIVGKTLEQSLMEVLEEEELKNMRAHQEEFDQIRAAELAEAQRMEAAEVRRAEEKQRRVEQERERVANERTVSKKVAARGFAHRYVGDVVSEVFGNMEETGFFYDPLVKEIEDSFMPWLLGGVTSSINGAREAHEILEQAVVGALKLSASKNKLITDKYNELQAEANKAAEEAKEAEQPEEQAANEGEGEGEGEGEVQAEGEQPAEGAAETS
uniref:Radial spoke protein 3 n=2 Tax=Guillardia theta TaxID=55529 RepID=A0A7S4NE24_GUITH